MTGHLAVLTGGSSGIARHLVTAVVSATVPIAFAIHSYLTRRRPWAALGVSVLAFAAIRHPVGRSSAPGHHMEYLGTKRFSFVRCR
jgi:hypothetical protein